MPTKWSDKPKGTAARDTEDDILATAHAFAAALHRVGAMDDAGFMTMDKLRLPAKPDYDGAEVKRIRAAARMSQPVFARLLGVEKSTVVSRHGAESFKSSEIWNSAFSALARPPSLVSSDRLWRLFPHCHHDRAQCRQAAFC